MENVKIQEIFKELKIIIEQYNNYIQNNISNQKKTCNELCLGFSDPKMDCILYKNNNPISYNVAQLITYFDDRAIDAYNKEGYAELISKTKKYNTEVNVYPLAWIKVLNINEIQFIVKWCRCFNVKFRVVSGGHNLQGWCYVTGGIIIDLSLKNNVYIDKNNIIHIDAGTNWAKVYKSMSDYDLHQSGGSCPDVCLGGFLSGGGYGATARKDGMGCDSVLEIHLVSAVDGKRIIANKKTNSDLFTACRGGTGGNYGIITKFIMQGTYMPWAKVITAEWSGINNITDVIFQLQNSILNKKLNTNLAVLFWIKRPDPNNNPLGEPHFYMRGFWIGDESEEYIIEQIQIAFTKNLMPETLSIGTKTKPANAEYQFLSNFETGDMYENYVERKETCYVEEKKPLSKTTIKNILKKFARDTFPYDYISIESYGGKIKTDDKFNVFIHRDMIFNWFLSSFSVTPEDNFTKSLSVLTDFSSQFSKNKYQNYPKIDYSLDQYFGNKLEFLKKVKEKYNPNKSDLMIFPQSIS